ncbi:MAG: hypothetical protein KatS3mg031_0529 [Chitinophagales bacterium]|nr:MAG: hypothetical protein KatS3mg031_0529 [Chitinophagales bacterium]
MTKKNKPKKKTPVKAKNAAKDNSDQKRKKSAVGENVKRRENKKSKSAAAKKSAAKKSSRSQKTAQDSTTNKDKAAQPENLSAQDKVLRLTLEESKPAPARPRITRSKSGNLMFQLEYTIRSSPSILYDFLTTPSGLAQWFADKVDFNEPHCTFEWDGSVEHATIIDSIEDEYVRYRWDYSDEDEYFEFRITRNEITGDTVLTITDFAPESEIESQKLLWDSQIKTLIHQIGG